MLLKTLLGYQQNEDVHVEVTENFYYAYCTQKYFFVEKYFESWDPKFYGPHNYLQIFYVAALIDKCGTTKHCPLVMF